MPDSPLLAEETRVPNLRIKVSFVHNLKLFSNAGYSRASQEFSINACNDVSIMYLMGKSPFPALEKFIESVASTGNVPGKIRCWYWFSAYELIIYGMSRNRYCEQIGREHKSNHVMYVVDLRRAIFYQKCYDPDCKGYRSPFCPVPLDCHLILHLSVIQERKIMVEER
ncbi:hypothetical protein SLE2022_373110 [Rubroshorea leprosula]